MKLPKYVLLLFRLVGIHNSNTVRAVVASYLGQFQENTKHTMKDNKHKKSKSSMSWISAVFVRIFVCQQKKKKKGLKRFVSFRSIQLKTPIMAENDNETMIVCEKVNSSKLFNDSEVFQSEIVKSR